MAGHSLGNMQKNVIIGIIAVAVVIAIAVPLASPLFDKGTSTNEPLPSGALLDGMDDDMLREEIMDDDERMMDDKMGDDKMMDDKMGDDKMMDDKMGDDKMMDDDKMGDDGMAGEMKDTQMSDDEMKNEEGSQDGEMAEMSDDAEAAIVVIMKDLEENSDTMSEEDKKMLEDMIEKIKKEGVSATNEMMEEEMPDAMPADMQEEMKVKKYSGTFTGADTRSHNVEGMVITVPTADGKTFLRLTENFKTENGPHLVVYLVPNYQKYDRVTDFVPLGDLKGTSGAQNYLIPEGTDLEKYNTALIWCKPFQALFGYAPLVSNP